MNHNKASSYWTQRRIIRENVAQHINSIIGEYVCSEGQDSETESTVTSETFEQHHVTSMDVCNGSNGNIDETVQTVPEPVACEFDGNVDINQFDDIEGIEPLNLSCESDSDTESNDDISDVLTCIKEWAVECQIPMSSLSSLLQILRPYFPTLPKDPRTLLRTKTKYDIVELGGGLYYHFGIESGILSRFVVHPEFVLDDMCVFVQVNIDGLPLFKSSNHQFWPILCRIEQLPDTEPFVVGLYSGKSKPSDVEEYLRAFKNEVNHLTTDGFEHKGMRYTVKVSSVICDTPARAFVKKVKSHTGYYGCDKCNQSGEWLGKLIFPETNATPRTDVAFDEMEDEHHHLGPSPLVGCGIGMVSQFPLDYMHLVCLGVMRRLLMLLIKGPLLCRLGPRVVTHISDSLVAMKSFMPREFARKPRALSEMDRWKATEFRQFLLYTGPVVLLNKVSDVVYKNFLLLFVSIHILVNPQLCSLYCDYAHKLLVLFVQHFETIYGRNMLVYNVHGLVHLAEDARRFGCLDNISAFPFENFLGKLKRMVRKPSFPLQQIIRRLHEKSEHHRGDKDSHKFPPYLKKKHNMGPVPQGYPLCEQYSQVHIENCCLTTMQGDNCVKVSQNIGLVRNVLLCKGDIHLVLEYFQTVANFFDYPLQSETLGIHKVSDLNGHLHAVPLSEIQCKCVLLPFRDANVVTPVATTSVW